MGIPQNCWNPINMSIMAVIGVMRPHQAQGSFPTDVGKMFVQYFDAKWGDSSNIITLLVVFDLLQSMSNKKSS